MGDNLYLAACSTYGEKERILSNGTWTFGNNLVIYGMHARAVQKIVETLGDVLDVNLIESRPGWGEYVRVRISLDIWKSLPPGKRVVVGDAEYVWVRFKFERLPQFCYFCGILEHGECDCLQWISVKEANGTSKFPYGPWLRVGSAIVKTRLRPDLSTEDGPSQSSFVAVDWFDELATTKGVVLVSPPQSLTVVDNTLSGENATAVCSILSAGRPDGLGMGFGPSPFSTHPGSASLEKPQSISATFSSRKENQPFSNVGCACRARLPRPLLTPSKRQLHSKFVGNSSRLVPLKKQKSGDDNSLVEAPVISAETRSGVSWHLSAIYGHSETPLKQNTWNLLRLLNDQMSRPWLCCGDFNEILDLSENLGGRVRPASQMRGFRDALDYCQLRSIPAVGPLYTWSNFQEGPALVHEWLDYFINNMDWLDLFPNCRVSNLLTPVFDHTCLVLTTEVSVQPAPRTTRLFKFESMWVGEQGCEESIARAWFLSSTSLLVDKIKQCSRHLSDWSKPCFGNVRHELAKKRKELEQLQSISFPSYPLHEIRRVKHDLNYLMKKEELMWQQRSCVQSLVDGDQNTHFFHFKASQRQRRNSISRLKDDKGVMHEGSTMLQLIYDYFSTLFSTTHPLDFDAVP
ncbi:uncharacterized protein LOC122306196 [Carya illinoinensis]|uniref:uncharacterized protein LOC122306196 n=1 Tax=Carya illinoinensis TaxID=32201 RepID=UPI001C726A37|nr:uncharacterized protein LOC122306196 [Carya illinoinensis]